MSVDRVGLFPALANAARPRRCSRSMSDASTAPLLGEDAPAKPSLLGTEALRVLHLHLQSSPSPLRPTHLQAMLLVGGASASARPLGLPPPAIMTEGQEEPMVRSMVSCE